MTTLADDLPQEITRVRNIQDTFKELRRMPNVIVEPQIMMMEHDIQAAIKASVSGDVVEMLRCHAALKTWED